MGKIEFLCNLEGLILVTFCAFYNEKYVDIALFSMRYWTVSNLNCIVNKKI